MTTNRLTTFDIASTISSAECVCEKFKDARKRADKAEKKCEDLLAERDVLAFRLKTEVVNYSPERILRSGNRMIVFWKDGTKTIVKRAEDEADSDYAAFTAALGIKLFGSNSALKRIITEAQKPKKKGVNKNGKEGIANK